MAKAPPKLPAFLMKAVKGAKKPAGKAPPAKPAKGRPFRKGGKAGC